MAVGDKAAERRDQRSGPISLPVRKRHREERSCDPQSSTEKGGPCDECDTEELGEKTKDNKDHAHKSSEHH